MRLDQVELPGGASLLGRRIQRRQEGRGNRGLAERRGRKLLGVRDR